MLIGGTLLVKENLTLFTQNIGIIIEVLIMIYIDLILRMNQAVYVDLSVKNFYHCLWNVVYIIILEEMCNSKNVWSNIFEYHFIWKCTQIQIGLLHTLTFTSKLTIRGRLRTKLYQRDDFNFPIVNFPFICSNIPSTPAYHWCVAAN